MDYQQRAVDMLNGLLAIDPGAVQAVIDHRVPVERAVLASDVPGFVGVHPDGATTLGPLGLINGLLGEAIVAAVYDQEGKLTGFVLDPKPGSVQVETGERGIATTAPRIAGG